MVIEEFRDSMKFNSGLDSLHSFTLSEKNIASFRLRLFTELVQKQLKSLIYLEFIDGNRKKSKK